MLASSLFELLVSLISFTGLVSSLPINEVLGSLGDAAPFEERGLVAEYTPLPNRATAAHLPKRTTMGPTTTQPHIAARPIEKRAGIDADLYLTSIASLISVASAGADITLDVAISNFIADNTPTGVDAEAFQTSLISIMSGAGNEVADLASAAIVGVGGIFGADSSNDETSPSGVVSTNGGTTYWSLPAYVSTWGGMNGSAQESWRPFNNYVGTYTDTPAATILPGDAIVQGSTTFWRSELFIATMSSLATIDSGMAQLSWTKHNVFSGFIGGNSTMTSTSASRAGVGAQMNTVAGANGSSYPTSVQSGNTAASTGGGLSLANSQISINVMAGISGAASSYVVPDFTTNADGVTITISAASQQKTGSAAAISLAPGILASCPTSTGRNGMYVACNRGGDPGLVTAASTNVVTSGAGTALAAGQTSLAASSSCTLAACSAMTEPYTSPGVGST